jgi:hypothetical protein
MKAGPRGPLEMIETKFFLELLMRLFANPARFDGARDILWPARRREG